MNTANGHQQEIDVAVGMDIGCSNSSMSVMREGRLRSIKTVDGEQVPSAIFLDTDGAEYVGNEAMLRAWKNPSRLYTHFKPQMFNAPNESVNGGPTRIELTAKLIKYLTSQLLAKIPELASYPQFGGDSARADKLALAFTVPASWGIPQQDAMRRAIGLAGIAIDAGEITFVSEPKAGSLRLAHEHGSRLRDGDTVLSCDGGGGTTDLIVLRFERGVWHEQSPPLGDPFLGGRLFTAAIAGRICALLKADCMKAFSLEDGLRLCSVADEAQREMALSIWLAAEEAKLKLSASERASVFVQTAQGKREVSLTLPDIQSVWAPLWNRMEKVVTEAMTQANIVSKDIKHVTLFGGSALLPSLRSRIANLTDRSDSQVLTSDDSAHVVSNGAAELAYHRDKSDQAMTGGLVLRMKDTSGGTVNKVLLRPNHIIPAGGQEVEQLGQCVRSPGGPTVLVLEPCVTKPGVRCAEPRPGLPVLLSNEEVIRLKRLTAVVDLPKGDHEVRASVLIDPSRTTSLVFSPVGLPDQEPIVVPLALEDENPEEIKPYQMELVLILDCSKSMQGEKLKQAKRAIELFLREIRCHGFKVALVKMGGEVEVVCQLTTDTRECVERMETLEASGGTLMTEALALTEREYGAAEVEQQRLVVLFSDGLPACAKSAIAQAQSLKKMAHVMCVGIGDDASPRLLKQIASSEFDYYEARMPSDILDCLYEVAELIHNSAAQAH